MNYLNCKGIGRDHLKGKKKSQSVKAITSEQWQAILEAVEDSAPNNRNWRRDWALIFLSGALGMRVGEARFLERSHFSELVSSDVVHVPTLKQSEKISFVCQHTGSDGERCGRKMRIKMSSAGKMHKCYRCGKSSPVPETKGKIITDFVLVDVDIVEEKTVGFIMDYLENQMRPDQQWLFDKRVSKKKTLNLFGTKPKKPYISCGHANRIFNTFAVAAGVDPRVSFHSLRHHRGVFVYSLFKDMVLCKDALRHKNIATTQIYAGLDMEQKQRYREELNKKAFDPLKKRRQK